jgi:hypothetical protein
MAEGEHLHKFCENQILPRHRTDTLHIALSEWDSDSSEALNENLVVDFDGEGRPVARPSNPCFRW